MLAAKLFGANDIRIVECEIPQINENEILLKTSAAAICGSDLRMILNGYHGIDAEHPRTLGHEISGVIEKIGTNVQGYQPGMRVSLAPNIGCGHCDFCADGNTHLCSNYQAFGINMDGGFAEYVRIPYEAISQGNIMVLDDSVPMDVAALFEPMSCVMNGQSRVHINLNDIVLVIGAGPIGIMHALLAKACGASKVYMRDLSRERLDQCIRIDPEIVPIYEDDLQSAVMKITKGRGVDVCITACPSANAQAESLGLMAMNGRILFFGGLPSGKDQVTIPTNLIHYKQLSVCGSTRGNVTQYRDVAKMAAANHLNLSALISKKYPIQQFEEAVTYAKSAQGLKTIISFE